MVASLNAAATGTLPLTENGILSRRPYISNSGKYAGHPVVAVNTGRHDASGQPIYGEKPIHGNATLRKDEWIDLEDQIIDAARERLVVVNDLMNAGLTYNVGGLGTIISEFEAGSEMTDADISMTGRSRAEMDRQEFDLQGVPIPVIHKEFSIDERMLLASRQRGADLETTGGAEAARSVARTTERMMFEGASINAKGASQYTVYGLRTFPGRATYEIADWSDQANVTNEDILADILAMIQKMETEERSYGPFNLYIPAAYSFRFRQDFKAAVSGTLMERVMAEEKINAVRTADMQTTGNVSMVEMVRRVWDLAIASDIVTVQEDSRFGWSNEFQVYAAWAPRFKQDAEGRVGVMHGSTA